MQSKVNLALAAGVALFLSACGGGAGSGSNAGGAVVAGGGGNTIAVSLGEEGPNDMFLRLSTASIPAGAVTFAVTNEGQSEHELIVLKTDTLAGDFPVMPKGEGMSEMGHGHDIDEDAPGIKVMGEVEDLASGASEELPLTLQPGHYALICNLRGHYTAGMFADFQVT